MKKLLAVLLTMVMTVTLSWSAMAVTTDGYFTIDKNGVLTECNKYYMRGDVIIPSGVTSIGNGVFRDCVNMTSVTIPDSVTSIGYDAFFGCTNLTHVAIPDSVTDIRNFAFSRCTSLTSAVISESMTSIGYGVFSNCTSLTTATIPDSVIRIGERAFSGCTSLTSITIPNSVMSIGEGAFNYDLTVCGQLESAANQYCCANGIRFVLVPSEPHSFAVADHILVNYTGPGGDVVIPEGLTSIGKEAFYTRFKLTSVVIPDSVTSIGESAFFVTGLTNVTIPNGVTSIGDNAFMGCDSLSSAIIPNSVTSIGESAFEGCDKLTSVTIPSSVTSMGRYAFADCSNLTSAFISDGVTQLSSGLFGNCTRLTKISIPDSVISIGDYAFTNCTNLEDITVPSSVTSIGEDAFAGCKNLTVYCYTDSQAEQYCIKEEISFVSLGVSPGTEREGKFENGSVWAISAEGEVSVTFSATADPNETILVGEYDNKGRFVEAKPLNAQNPVTQIDPAMYSVKLFYLDDARRPLAPSVIVWGK